MRQNGPELYEAARKASREVRLESMGVCVLARIARIHSEAVRAQVARARRRREDFRAS